MKTRSYVVLGAALAVAVGFAPTRAEAQSVYVTGAGAGGGPHVQVFRASDNALLASYFAYASGVTQGVRVAVCRAADGSHILFTVPGPGAPAHLRAFNALSGGVIAETFAWPTTLTLGSYVACGDFYGDGGLEVAVAADRGGGPHVKVLRLVGNTLALVFETFAYDASFTGGVRLAAGKFGWGRDLLVTAPGPGGSPHIKMWDLPTAQAVVSFIAPITDLQGLPFPAYSAGVFPAKIPDVTGDGREELAVSYTTRQVWRRGVRQGDYNPFVVGPAYTWTGVFVASGSVKILNGANLTQPLADVAVEACYPDWAASQDHGFVSSVAELNSLGGYNMSMIPFQNTWSAPLPDYAPPVAGTWSAGSAFMLVGNRKGGLVAPVKAYGPSLAGRESTPPSGGLFGGLVGYSRPCVVPTWQIAPYGNFGSEIYVSAD